MDALTQEVQNLYTQYPFPNADYRIEYGIHLLRYFSEDAPKGKKSLLENANVLDAGCGTGNAVSRLAKQFSPSRFTAVDLTPASLEVARQNAAKLGATNITFRNENLLTMDLGQTFDVIQNMGVLHHLSDMSAGIKNLAKHLDKNGRLILWLYGTYGRFRLNLNQAMFRILFKNVDSLPQKVDLAKRALTTFPREWTTCHFNAPTTKIEDDFDKSLEFAFQNEAWLVDQFLHVNEKTVNMEDILKLFDAAGLQLSRWLLVSQDLESYTSDPDLIKIYRELEPRDKLLFLDLLVKPNYYLVVARKISS